MVIQVVLLISIVIPAVLWGLIAVAGAAPVFSFENIRLSDVSNEEGRGILTSVYACTSVLDSDELREKGFVPLGVYRAEGLTGQPNIVAWERTGEATWLCGYLLPDRSCQLDLVSLLAGSMLTTGTTKDGQMFPTSAGGYVQTFDIESFVEFLDHHQKGLAWLSSSHGLVPDRSTDFADAFEDSISKQGRFIRSLPLWIVRIPWWYFTRRDARHNRSVQQLYGEDMSF